jgi:cytochrome c oxidase subunit 1
MGMPRRYHNYPEHMQPFHVVSTVGAFALGSGLLVTVVYLAWAVRRGELAGPNPWHSASFEWRTPSPPPEHNFETIPDFTRGPYDYSGADILADETLETSSAGEREGSHA